MQAREPRARRVAGLAHLHGPRAAEPATWHARRCLELCEANGIGDWDLAYAYEALARAHALAGDGEAEQWKSKAREAGDAIADAEDRKHFDEDFATL